MANRINHNRSTYMYAESIVYEKVCGGLKSLPVISS